MSVAMRLLFLAVIVGVIGAFRFSQTPIRHYYARHPSRVFATQLDDSFIEATEKVKSALQSQAASFPPLASMMTKFLEEYAESNFLSGQSPDTFQRNVGIFFKEIAKALKGPHQFSPFHEAIRSPFDFYAWGNDFLRPMIISERSKLEGRENVDKIEQYIQRGDNVIFLSNHQTEADPQVISILLESIQKGSLAEKVVFVAGHKVTTDPVAIPFSMGRNLICIHSKKHIKNPPEDLPRKQAQNLDSMKALGELFERGGTVVWVAPSGGRDRPNEEGKFVVADFDSKAIDMFKILAKKSSKTTHFFPMAMFTHQLVPPPKTVSSGVGEERSGKRGAVSVAFLDETDGLGEIGDKKFAQQIHERVVKAYDGLVAWHNSQ
eukprot:gene15551-17431_t